MTPVSSDPTVPSPSRRGGLALALQEPLTTVTRLRARKQVAADAESFRTRSKQVLASAEEEARAIGYSTDDVRFALFAVIALVDESVLNSGQPMFADWSSRTLQQEVFGVHMAGELFYQYLEQLLSRADSADLADVLEVYLLALLLGFKGRYNIGGGGEAQQVARQLAARIEAIRGAPGELSPHWRVASDDIARRRDRWVPRLAVVAAVSFLVAVGLFGYYTVSLRSGAAELRTETAQLSP
jgi:type VI secretion system protein ImpK